MTGRVGYTWEALPGLIFYSQYATAADPTVANIFILRPTQPLLLTTSRIYETGVKHLFWDKRAEWTFSAFDIERENVYSAKGGQQVNIAGKIKSKGIEVAGAVNPIGGLKLWGNLAFVQSRYCQFRFHRRQRRSAVLFRQHARQRSAICRQRRSVVPLRDSMAGRIRRLGPPRGDRFNFQDNLVTMDDYTVADAYVFVDIPKSVFQAVDQTRLTFRVRNLTNRQYAVVGRSRLPRSDHARGAAEL